MENPKFEKNILITGGAGFIGNHVVRLFVNKYPDYRIVCYDKLTYAGNLENLKDLEGRPNYVFVKGDICDAASMEKVMRDFEITSVIHLAAESHVDRSIRDPLAFARTNVMGTLTLLDCARRLWEQSESGYDGKLFYHISTDEVYGALEIDSSRKEAPFGDELFVETRAYAPHSPYSASKASSDHFVRAYHDTYGMPVVVTNCSNNYGPYQFPEKLIPLLVNNILNKKPLPVYGKGENVRDWLYVEDHAGAIDCVFHKGKSGETYNIGGLNEWRNIDLVKKIVKVADAVLGREEGESLGLITYVEDRKGHDLRYAIDNTKIMKELGWRPDVDIETGLRHTVEWYLSNKKWLENVASGDYLKYYEEYYGNRN